MSSFSLGDPAQKSLPAWAATRAAFRVTAAHFNTFLTLAWKWIVFVLVPSAVLLQWLSESELPGNLDWLHGPVLLLQLIVGASVAVAWHRFLLRADRATNLRFDRNVWRYLAIDFVIVVLIVLLTLMFSIAVTIVVVTPSSALAALASATTCTLILLLLFRISLLLPAVAVSSAADISSIWAGTKGHVLAIAIGSLLTFGLVFLSVVASLSLEVLALPRSVQWFLVVTFDVLSFVLAVVWWTYLSLAYRALFEPEVELPD
ncbi:MAG: hypothetical protein Q7T86_16005 [Hyphomicrobiaceae bacterium]|nr:hypothetical protein [Hyphomicrobiaceae bacterium]